MSICDLDSDAGENACDILGKAYGKEKVLFCHCDVTDYVQYEEAFQTTLAEFDNIDIVINNAEIMNDKFWELEVDVNLNGSIRGTLLALQFLGKGIIIININGFKTNSQVSYNKKQIKVVKVELLLILDQRLVLNHKSQHQFIQLPNMQF